MTYATTKTVKEVISNMGGTNYWARRLKVHASTVRRWKKNNNIPGEYLDEIFNIFHINMGNLNPTEERRASPRKSSLKRFVLRRVKDVSGVSGTGIVAEGVQFTNGVCVISWLSKFTSQSIFSDLQTLLDVHGHEGSTKVEFIDCNY